MASNAQGIDLFPGAVGRGGTAGAGTVGTAAAAGVAPGVAGVGVGVAGAGGGGSSSRRCSSPISCMPGSRLTALSNARTVLSNTCGGGRGANERKNDNPMRRKTKGNPMNVDEIFTTPKRTCRETTRL